MNKKILITLILLTFILSKLYSQSIELRYSGGIVNNDTIEVYGDISQDTLSAYVFQEDTTYYFAYEAIVGIDVRNKTANGIDVQCKKRYMEIVPNTENTFCWVSCFGPFTFESVNPVNIPANETLTIFSGHYKPKGTIGCTTIAYTFFNNSDIADSATVIIKYIMGNCSENSIDEEVGNRDEFSQIYPNPARNEIYFDNNLTGSYQAEFELFNSLGSLISCTKFSSFDSRPEINTHDLKSGIYFYRIVVESRMLTSGQVIIQK